MRLSSANNTSVELTGQVAPGRKKGLPLLKTTWYCLSYWPLTSELSCMARSPALTVGPPLSFRCPKLARMCAWSFAPS